MLSNTIKYEYTKGCPNDVIGVLSIQSYKDKKDELNAAKGENVVVEHGNIDLILKVTTYNKILDKSGKIVERRDVKAKQNDEPIH